MTRRIALFLLLCTASAASAIIIRHDREDARYQALGARFPAVGHFGGRVDCTLIAPQWALGAAHTVEGIGPWDPPPQVVFGGETYGVVKIILHPDRVPDTADTAGDLALFKLDRPVRGIAPVPLYEKDDELGKVAVLVGHGQTGTGLTGPQQGERDNKIRGATNRIDRIDPTSIIFKFETPPDGTDLEGLAGPGDSGGPALLEQDGKLYLLGVGCFSGAESQETAGRYGTSDHYARVSTRRSWILDTIAADPPPTIAWSAPAKLKDGSWPDTPTGRAAAAFFHAYNAGDAKGLEMFFADFMIPRPERSPAVRAGAVLELFATYGPYDLEAWSTNGPRELRVLVHSKKTGEWRSVHFGLTPGDAPKIERMFMKDEAAR
jgi:hypothetical protein